MSSISNQSASATKPFQKRFLYSLTPPLLAAGLMTIAKLSEWLSHKSFTFLGLEPRELKGLSGILFFPFLHADSVHLMSNLLPFIFLSVLIYNIVPQIFWKVYGFTFLLSGFWTWCFARPGIVIGASGWVYALLGFLLVAGFARLGRKTMVIAGGLAFLYGGMVYGLAPTQTHISWEGHLMGLLAGSMAAFYWKKEIKAAEENENPVRQPLTETEAPYPYWQFPFPHFVDANKNIVHPEMLVWENGKPRLKTPEELNPPESSDPEPDTLPEPRKTTSFTQGGWTIHVS